jgi:hypothetical protein
VQLYEFEDVFARDTCCYKLTAAAVKVTEMKRRHTDGGSVKLLGPKVILLNAQRAVEISFFVHDFNSVYLPPSPSRLD